MKRTLFLALATCAFLMSALSLSGCGGDTPEFSQETKDSPESLAQEFSFRYKDLPARASAKAKAKAIALEKAKAKVPDVDAQTKSSRAEEATKRENAPTLDGLISDTAARLARLSPDAGKKFVEILAADKSIDPADLTLISERLPK